MKPTTKPTLIWAIDPIETKTRPSAANYEAIRQWAREMGWEIQPVTVATPSVHDLERGLLGSVNRYQAALDSYLKGFSLPAGRRGRILVNEQATQAGAVTKLLRYAKEEGAAAIAVSSHGRSGLDRLVLGSFAETVLAKSPWPVFFLGHERAANGLTHPRVLFPTNFSSESWGAFRELLRAVDGGTKLELVLFHAIPYPIPPAGMGVYLPDGYVEDQEKQAVAEGQRWIAEAARHGVKAEAVVRVCGIGFLSGESVLEAAAELGVTAIVMTATSNALGRLLLGSVAFPVFRANRFLTLVYGPNATGDGHSAGARAHA